MLRKNENICFALLIFLFQLLNFINIETAISSEADTNPSFISFSRERMSFQVVSGFISSPTFLASTTIKIEYWQTNLRLGWMSSELKMSDSWMRGRFQTLIEGTFSEIHEGPGDYMAGITALLRYNFFQPDWKIIPYLQVGLGAVYNNVYKDLTQNAIGQAIEFTPQFSGGIRYIINRKISFDVEGIFHHISNAGLDDRNGGINAFGGFIGLTCCF